MLYRGLFDSLNDGPESIWLFDSEDNTWELTKGRSPTSTWDAAMCWDPNSQRVIEVGGGNLSGTQPWTFGWNAQTGSWEVLSTDAPPLRKGHSMAFDATSGKVVLFGGTNASNQRLGDTWEWDGTSWTQRNDSPFLAREQHAVAYDPARGGIVMFGGLGTVLLNDTWFWNTSLGLWVPVAFAGPTVRQSHAMAHDPIDGGILLVGGSTGTSGSVMADQWFLPSGASTWVPVSTPFLPGARHEHAMITHEADGCVYLIAGEGPSFSFGDVWRWNGAATGWESIERPGTGLAQSAWSRVAVDPISGSAFMYGGLGDQGRTWRWNIEEQAWDLLSATGPGPRQWHVFITDEQTGKILLYGGLGGGVSLGDTWLFDPATETWEQLETTAPPGIREQAGFTYDPVSQRVIVYGGRTPFDSYSTETWSWDGTTNTWSLLRFEGFGNSYPGPTLGFDRSTDELVLYRDHKIWYWDRANLQWLDQGDDLLGVERAHATMVYSTLLGRLVFIGGLQSQGWYNDMWLRDATAGVWERLVLKTSTTRAMWPSAVELPSDHTLLLSAARTYTWHCEDPYYCAGDVNNDRRLDFFDVSQYLAWFAASDARADLVHPYWVFDFFDVSEYLDEFSRGCP